MRPKVFKPTSQQQIVIAHSGNAFITACPGAGKTQVLVERAKSELRSRQNGPGLAFLSFTNAAILELKQRLQAEAVLETPPFPHFAGTFDSFLWQFFIAPLGIPGCAKAPRLVIDLENRPIIPWPNARELPLSCFSSKLGKLIPEEAKKYGFDVSANPTVNAQYEAKAKACRKRFHERGELGFRDVREIVRARLADPTVSARLSLALGARFCEVIVDEAQDCNPEDLAVIQWLRKAGIATKIICDPHQSIYGFRGGVTNELFGFRDSLSTSEKLVMSGNFRSNRNICNAIAAFRPPGEQNPTDEPLGSHANDSTNIHVLLYGGAAIPAAIGTHFRKLVEESGLDLTKCRVLSSTLDAAFKSIGQQADSTSNDMALRLASAVTAFYLKTEASDRKGSLETIHDITLKLGGTRGEKTYRQQVLALGLEPEAWRPAILALCHALRFDLARDKDAAGWLERARKLLTPYLAAGAGSISHKLKNNAALSSILTSTPQVSLNACTIHSVKGQQFPGVCVVLSASPCKALLDYLETGEPAESAEGARKLYVAASRAEQLLVLAVPRNQGARLIAHIEKTGAVVKSIQLASDMASPLSKPSSKRKSKSGKT